MKKLNIKLDKILITVVFLLTLMLWLSISDALNKVDNSIIIEDYTFDEDWFINAKGILRFTAIFNMELILLITISGWFCDRKRWFIVSLLSSIMGIVNTIMQKTALETMLTSRDWQLDYIKRCEEAMHFQEILKMTLSIDYVILTIYAIIIVAMLIYMCKKKKDVFSQVERKEKQWLDYIIFLIICILNAAILFILLKTKTNDPMIEKLIYGISNVLVLIGVLNIFGKLPVSKWKKEIKSLDSLMKIIMFALIIMYIILYIKGFVIYDYKYAGYEGVEDFDLFMKNILQTVGEGFSFALIAFWLIHDRKSYFKRVLLLIIAQLQLLYIGVPNSDVLSLNIKNIYSNENIPNFNSEKINAIGRVAQERDFAARHNDLGSVAQYNMILDILQIIQMMSIVIILLSIIYLLLKSKKEEQTVDSLDGKVSLTKLILNGINLVMVFKLSNMCGVYINSCAHIGFVDEVHWFNERIDQVVSWGEPILKGMAIPLILFQLIFISKCISKKWYLLVSALYYMQGIVCTNLLYYIKNRYRLKGKGNVNVLATEYLECTVLVAKVFLVIGILRYIYLLIKHLYKKISKKEFVKFKSLEITENQYTKHKIFILLEALIWFGGYILIWKDKLNTFADVTISKYGQIDIIFEVNIVSGIGKQYNYFECMKAMDKALATDLLPVMIMVAVVYVIVCLVQIKMKNKSQ